MATVPAPSNSRTSFRNVYIYFALLIPAAMLGFGPFLLDGLTFSGRSLTPTVLVHATLMVLWVLMLTAQAWFIRTNRFRLHRWVGRSSYVIAPLILMGVLIAQHEQFNHPAEGSSTGGARLEVFGFGMDLAFAVTWGLAILYRKRTPLHVRFMISTAFAIGTAIVFRIISKWLTWLPGLGSIDAIAAGNWIVLTLPLLALIAMDWRMGIKRSPFWVVTVLIGIMHIGYWTYGRTAGWVTFVEWFAALPLRGS
jgi:hypothetical protein